MVAGEASEMIVILVLVIACVLPRSPESVRCDQIELNLVYNDDGRLWLSQVLFWRWEPTVGWACEGWRRADQGLLRTTPRGWRWEERGLSIEAPQLRRSWTQFDREALNRSEWLVEWRTLRRVAPWRLGE